MNTEITSPESQTASAMEETGTDEIDIQTLAEEIYRLLKRELMLENERRGWRGGPDELN